MKRILKPIKKSPIIVGSLMAISIVIGLFVGRLSTTTEEKIAHPDRTTIAEDHLWTCSMHPQIKLDKPGLCPICSMELIPLKMGNSSSENNDINAVKLSESAIKLASIQTSLVTKEVPSKVVDLLGKVEADERSVSVITARFSGRIEKLFINFTGQKVTKGDKMATIYSPELISAQKELLEAAAFKTTRPSLYLAAKGKLRLWNLSDSQIETIENIGEPLLYFDVLAPISGTVSMRQVATGDYIKEGSSLFKVIDLSRVWVMFDAYENDLSWLKNGDSVTFNIPAIPDKIFTSTISFIEPFIDAKTRVAKVRIAMENRDYLIKPEMFANGTVKSKATTEALIIPKSAILWTGKRAIVYVKVPNNDVPTFLFREVILGAETSHHFIVIKGLSEGEEIATNGVFKIDAAAQLQGLPSMMNPSGEKASTPHDMSKMVKTNSSSEHVMIKVAGNCDLCKDRIESAANAVTGVISAQWEAESQMLHLEFNKSKTTSETVQKAIAKIGHDTEKYKADESAYKGLAACCLYERMSY